MEREIVDRGQGVEYEPPICIQPSLLSALLDWLTPHKYEQAARRKFCAYTAGLDWLLLSGGAIYNTQYLRGVATATDYRLPKETK